MGVSLSKGGNVNLSKESGNTGGSLDVIDVCLGWDPRTTDGEQFDLDSSAFALTSAGKVKSDQYFVFFSNPDSPEGAIHHHGDNRTGQGDGDDETITITLSKLPADIEKVLIAVTIYDADVRKQNFGQVPKSFVRIVDKSTGTELARFDLGEDFSTETAVQFGELYRNGGDWKFRAIGQGYASGLRGLAMDTGVNVG